MDDEKQPLWVPSDTIIKNANMTKFINFLLDRGIELGSYDELWKWSIENREKFWATLWDFCEVKASSKWDEVLVSPDNMLKSRWFTGARLNFAENLLRFRDEKPALIFNSEGRDMGSITYKELYHQVARLAHSFRSSGIKTGDRIAGFVPNMIEPVVAMLAAASIGAIWSSCSPDFGIRGILDRFGQIEPRILFTADGYNYNGKTFDSLERINGIIEDLPSIEKVIVIPYLNKKPDISSVPDSILYEDYLAERNITEVEYTQLPFDHPLYVLYSSGTTGIPKCMVHGSGGTLLQHLKELVLHTDLCRQDRIFYFTTCGWMMWNWLVSSLSVGATILLYDGSPFHPDPGVLFKFAQENEMTIFGTSAKYLSALEKTGLRPSEKYELKKLRSVLSTGSPLSVENFHFVYEHVNENVCLASISGGTDIISCFALGNPIAPVWEGELQCRGLGMNVDVFDHEGNSLTGVQGELVCKSSFPSQPVHFWNDPDGNKYRSAYFDVYPNVWRHGDYVELTPHNGMIIYGRSDATLNPGGVRIGTAEIYRQAESMDEILDSVAVGQNWEDDVRVILFVKLVKNVVFNDEFVVKLRKLIRTNCTPRHVPAIIIPVKDIPYTISGKKVELAVKKMIENLPVLNRDALKNPEALEYYRNLPQLLN